MSIDFKALAAPFHPSAVSWRVTDKTRFWPIAKKLEHRSMPEPMSGCQLWLAAINASGYGIMGLGPRTFLAHRVAWEAKNGPVPAGLQVLHKCDVRSCINPDHLFLGTNTDNVADKVAKGRAVGEGPIGEHHPNAKLKIADVLAIRNSSESNSALAKRYRVSTSLISDVRRGKRWAHVKMEDFA